MRDEALYVIVPYFNFANYTSGLFNLKHFIQNITTFKNVNVVIVEGYNNECLPDLSDKVYKHIKLHVKDTLWVKENLINIGFKHLPSTWKYGAWIDRDIIFCNPNWVEESVEKLKESDLIQPWTECLFLDSKYQHEHIDFGEWKIGDTFIAQSFCSIEKLKRNKQLINYKKFSHPGQAWCVTREFYEHMGGLYEHCILGSGDGVMMFSLMGIEEHEMIVRLGESAKKFYSKVQECRLDSINGMIIHNYHGSLAKRKYVSKHQIYDKHNYNPLTFLKYNEHGLIEYTSAGRVIEQDIKEYFIQRDEDSK